MMLYRRQFLLAAFKLFDLGLLVFACFLGNTPLLFSEGFGSFSHFFSIRIKLVNFLLFGAVLLAWHLIFYSYGLYKSKRLTSRYHEIRDVLKAVALSALLLYAAGAAFAIKMVTNRFILVFWLSATLLAVVSRVCLKSMLQNVRLHERNLRRVLIVGTNARAMEFGHRLESHPEAGYRVIGFADMEWRGAEEVRSRGGKIVCDLDHLWEFLRQNVVDEVVISLPIRSFHSDASKIAHFCEEMGIIVRLPVGLFDLKFGRTSVEEYEGESVISIYTGSARRGALIAKRTLDFLVTSLLITILSPLMVTVAILIKLTSPGPIFFRQKRVGLNKRLFSIWKFRTMIPDAEARIAQLEKRNEAEGPVFKIRNDPRITPIGALLRKTSIDELPQLFNVLHGDMSLVGPRPLPVRDYQGFDQDWQRRRFSVTPGITCLWQIEGRSDVGFEKWMKLDMQYIDEWSFWLDLQILARTIPAVLKGSGAA
jgi:exopolysaccharide biosynthesis polyprenyl glycosylphosphotransferase